MTTWAICPLFNELDVLELRLGEMSDTVERFVIAEADRTYAGAPKPLWFCEERERFSPWLDRITYLPVLDMPAGADPWAREHHQRRALGRGLGGLEPDDLVILTDLDEIVRTEAILWAKRHVQQGTWRFLLHMHLYHLLWRWPDLSWRYQIARCARGRDVPRDIQAWRLRNDPAMPAVGEYRGTLAAPRSDGWHCAYFGGGERIRYKLAEHAHPEMALPEHESLGFLEACVREGRDLFGRDAEHLLVAVAEDELPAYAVREREALWALWPEGALGVEAASR